MLIIKFKKQEALQRKNTSIFVAFTYTHLLVCVFLKHINYFIKSKNARVTKQFSH